MANAQTSTSESARQSLDEGNKKAAAGQDAEARPLLEKALELADSDEIRLAALERLIPIYQRVDRHEVLRDAVEGLVAIANRDYQRENARLTLRGFIVNRGKLDETVDHYSAMLDADPNDFVAAYLLSEFLYEHTDDNRRTLELFEWLEGWQPPADGSGPMPLSEGERERLAGKIRLVKERQAREFVRTQNYPEAAEMFFDIAPGHQASQAYHYKEAAKAWLEAGNREKADEAISKALAGPPDSRSESLRQYFHQDAAVVLEELGRDGEALQQWRNALYSTAINRNIQRLKRKLEAENPAPVESP